MFAATGYVMAGFLVVLVSVVGLVVNSLRKL